MKAGAKTVPAFFAMKQFLTAMVAMTFVPAMALSQDKTDQMKITVHASDTALSATLDDTAAAQDFASMLPLTLTLEDYHGIEKVADLGRKLDASDNPDSYAPKAGDITQYAPWKNIAIFVAPFQASRGLVRLGEFDGDFSTLSRSGPIEVRIERAD